MTEQNIPVTEDELHAYVDNELPAERRAAMEAWLTTHPEDAARVAAWRAISDELRAKYDGVVDEPVPPRLSVDALARPPRRWMMGAIAASLLAFAAGGGVGWIAHGTTRAQPSMFTSFTGDALEAHRLYVVEVRHPVDVVGSERTHLQQWLSKRCGWEVRAPELDASGLKLVGGRLLPGPNGPASFLMYETASGERFTVYASRATADAQMRYATQDGNGTMFWADRGVGFVVSGPTDRERLAHVARMIYEQNEKVGL